MKDQKKCKGTGKALGYGCGELVPVQRYGKANRQYGLGKSCGCWLNWVTTTKEGEALIKQATLQGKRRLEKANKRKEIERKKQDREAKIALMGVDAYRSKIVQPLINKIVRLIDYGCPCIASNNYGKMNGGHYISVGANRTLALNLHNIHIQSFESNHFRSGDQLNYQAGIIKTYGINYLGYMDALRGCPALKLTKEQLQQIATKARAIIKHLSTTENQYQRTPKQRLALRNQYNTELEIYPPFFSVYTVQNLG